MVPVVSTSSISRSRAAIGDRAAGSGDLGIVEGAETPGELLEHGPAQLGPSGDEGAELGVSDAHEVTSHGGDGGGGAPAVVDGRELAEQLAGPGLTEVELGAVRSVTGDDHPSRYHGIGGPAGIA